VRTPLPSPLPSPASGALGLEMRLLRRAEAEIRAGDPRQAMALLAQHAEQFSSGAMSEERAAFRVLALCALDRIDEAEAEAEHFARDYPRSPLRGRVSDACVPGASSGSNGGHR
jgi:hypothetical protein